MTSPRQSHITLEGQAFLHELSYAARRALEADSGRVAR